jgi:RNA recognition motif-containing protein
MIGKRYLDIKPAKGKNDNNKIAKVSIPYGCKRLFVKNLPYNMVDDDVKNEFKSCGVIEDVRLVRNWSTKLFKGFAYIDFKDIGSVKKAIEKYHGKQY